MSAATYAFLPWLRQGLAASISTIDDGTTSLSNSTTVNAVVTLNATALASVPISIFGPADVAGIDLTQVVRCDPPDGTQDCEPDYLPVVEFARPEMPWLLTPAAANSSQQLRPWLVLIVVQSRSGVSVSATGGQPLPVLTISSRAAGELPNLAQSTAWAHVQVAGGLQAGETLDSVLATSPERMLSRLIAPRSLQPMTSYIACVVPAFLAGVQAGLGQTPSCTDLTPAWLGTEDEITLPVYYHWSFQTADDSDFESLVKKLQPYPLPIGVGKRDLDIRHPGMSLAVGQQPILGLESALQPPGSAATPWSPAAERAFATPLITLLNRHATVNAQTPADQLVSPPIYGRWHAGVTRVAPAAQTPYWLNRLNLDPRTRVSCALGTLVVQSNQEALMASAWDQLGDVLQANQLLRQAQLARACSAALLTANLLPLSTGDFFAVVAPALARIALAQGTALNAFLANGISPLYLTGAARRLVRPRGPLSRRFQRRTGQGLSPGGLITGAAGCAYHPGPRKAITGMATVPEQALRVMESLAYRTPTTDLTAAWSALATLANRLIPGAGATCTPLDLASLRQEITSALNPETTIPARILPRLEMPGLGQGVDPIRPVMAYPQFPTPMYLPLLDLNRDWICAGLSAVPTDSVALLQTDGSFVESFMVGLNHEMARTLLWRGFPTDQRGSYFRQFWDPSGRVPAVTTPAEIEAAKDITPLNTWGAHTTLGSHLVGAAGGGNLVLLIRGELLRRYPGAVISAVAAVWQTPSGGGAPVRVLSQAATDTRFPQFTAGIPADTTLIGFDLTASMAQGSRDPAANDPGWFIVIQQQPGSPRFGFSIAGDGTPNPTSWDDIDWSLVVLDAAGYIDVNATLSALGTVASSLNPPWQDAADALAAITLRHPFRMAIHASDLMPP